MTMNRVATPGRIDWRTIRDTIDLAAVATGLLGPAPGRRGEHGRRLWWPCPFHEDQNPSFCVRPGGSTWNCFGCGASGDAATLAMKLEGLTFREAVSFLAGETATSGESLDLPRKPRARPAAEPSGLTEADALALVESAAAWLWTPEEAEALAYLRDRGLNNETIRSARLGVALPLDLPGHPRGIVIPWFLGDRLVLVKLRQPEGVRPKYREVFRDPARLVCYPGPGVVRRGAPLVVSEGELDALLLGQELSDLAAVVTLGSASARPTPATLGAMLSAAPWFIATDNDTAGDKAAAGWPARARRVRPPEPFKDWTEAHQGGVDLRQWWIDRLAGVDGPPRLAREEPARSDEESPKTALTQEVVTRFDQEVASQLSTALVAPNPAWPPRDPALDSWPVDRRERWGRRANELEGFGMAWNEAESKAFAEVLAELGPTDADNPSPCCGAESDPGETHCTSVKQEVWCFL